MQQVSLLLPVDAYDYLHITRMCKVRKLVLWDVGRASMMRAMTTMPSGGASRSDRGRPSNSERALGGKGLRNHGTRQVVRGRSSSRHGRDIDIFQRVISKCWCSTPQAVTRSLLCGDDAVEPKSGSSGRMCVGSQCATGGMVRLDRVSVWQRVLSI